MASPGSESSDVRKSQTPALATSTSSRPNAATVAAPARGLSAGQRRPVPDRHRHRPAEVAAQPLGLGLVDLQHADAGALGEVALHDGPTVPVAGPGDQGDGVVEPARHGLLLTRGRPAPWPW